MSLPIIEKNWRYQVNQVVNYETSTAVICGKVHLAIKNLIKGEGTWTDSQNNPISFSSPWEVVASNGRVSGLSAPGEDILTNIAEMVPSSGGNQFWILLRNNQSNCELMFGSGGAVTSNTMRAAISIEGFSNFTATALPSAGDASIITGAFAPSSGTQDYIIHAIMTSDGSFRILLTRANVAIGTWFFDVISSPKSGVVSPYVWGFISANTQVQQATTASGGFLSGASSNLRFIHNQRSNITSFTSEGDASGLSALAANTPNDFDSTWYAGRMGYWGHSFEAKGKMGEVADVWIAPSGRNTGDSFPDSPPANQFKLHGGYIYPWNTSTVISST